MLRSQIWAADRFEGTRNPNPSNFGPIPITIAVLNYVGTVIIANVINTPTVVMSRISMESPVKAASMLAISNFTCRLNMFVRMVKRRGKQRTLLAVEMLHQLHHPVLAAGSLRNLFCESLSQMPRLFHIARATNPHIQR